MQMELVEEQNALIAANADYEEMKALHATEVAELKKERSFARKRFPSDLGFTGGAAPPFLPVEW